MEAGARKFRVTYLHNGYAGALFTLLRTIVLRPFHE